MLLSARYYSDRYRDGFALECQAAKKAHEEIGPQLFMLCEIPSNVFLAEQLAERFDGFSIGSNDLTQRVLGVDRDSGELSELFDERDEAVKTAIVQVIKKAHQSGCKVGICGQVPSGYIDFA